MLTPYNDLFVSVFRSLFFRLLISCIVFSVSTSQSVWAQSTRRSSANTQSIDPVRAGDSVEAKILVDWIPGTILSYQNGMASFEYSRNGRVELVEVPIDKLRFPNGEGHWMIWRNASGKVKHEARYIARDETSVLIRKEDGSELMMPIDSLALDLKQRVKSIPVTGKENMIDGAEPVRVGDRVQVRSYSQWIDGIVKRLLVGEAEVDFEEHGRSATKTFRFNDIRFPNGEGHWRQWSDKSGAFKIIGRYISRTETDVTIRKEDETEITVPISRLAPSLVKLLAVTPVTGKENMVDGVNLLRVGDNVQVRNGSRWDDGVIVESLPGAAMVQRREGSRVTTERFELKNVRYPNGEGAWQKWTDSTGNSVIVARFLRRNETHVTLLKEDGKTVSVAIDRLDAKLKQKIEQSITITPRPEKVEFAMKPKTVSFMGGSSGKMQLSLPDSMTQESVWTRDAGFGFPLTHGDEISAVIPLTGEDPGVVVGTFASTHFDGDRLTRLYWTKPTQQKSIPGPSFQPDERIVDYSASQQRLITMQVSEGHWEQPIMFCSYRLKEGEAFAVPEYAWEIAENKESIGRGSSYKARLVGDSQLLLADGNSVSLYDFSSRAAVFTIGNLRDNHFTLHPSKKYFAVNRRDGGFSIHDTETGLEVVANPESGGIGFSQDGSQLICVGDKSISIWKFGDSPEPRVLQKRNLHASAKSSITLLDDKWIWADSSIYSISKEIAIWNYTGGDGVSIAHREIIGDRLLVSGTDRNYGEPSIAYVGIAKVPHKSAIEKMDKVDTESMIVLKPGSGIRIDAAGDPRIRAGVLKAIAANNWHEDPNSEIVLSASAKQGKTEQVTYERSSSSRFGFGRSGIPGSAETISVTPWMQNVEIKFRDTYVWSTASGGVPQYLQIKESETISEVVSKATQPSYYLFENLGIPAEMLYPQYRDGLGKTSITPNGFVDRVFEIAPIKAK